jgi:hypothetical protein
MFGLGKKKEEEKDPKKAIENAEKTLNTGLTGMLTKGFMGKDFVNKMNAGLEMGKNAVNTYDMSNYLAANGMPGTAEVLSITDTGKLINFNPVVVLKIMVTPSYGSAFEAEGESVVSKIAIPRVGDKVNIKYNPNDTKQFVVV